jgi:hypothetical protein
MYVQCYIVAHFRIYCYLGNATICSLFIFVGVDVTVNNKKVSIVAMERQQWVPLALLSSHKLQRSFGK